MVGSDEVYTLRNKNNMYQILLALYFVMGIVIRTL